MTPAAKRWLEAGKTLARDSLAKVRCPENDDGTLVVTDVPLPDGGVERWLTCDTCGAQNAILRPSSGGGS